jgi:hypothetical protein
MDMAYNPIIAVQSSAFLMTLNRKGLIRHYAHALWYTAALVLSMYHMHVAYNSWCWVFWAKCCLVFVARVKLGLSKYLIWVIAVATSLPETQEMAKEVASRVNEETKLGLSIFVIMALICRYMMQTTSKGDGFDNSYDNMKV